MKRGQKCSNRGSSTIEFIILTATIIGFVLVALNSSGFFTNSYRNVLDSSAGGLEDMGNRIGKGKGITGTGR